MARNQKEIPGTERETDEEVDAAAADVYELTSERLEVHEREKGARTMLLELMKKKGMKSYLYVDGEDSFEVVRSESEKVSVKKARNRKPAAEE